jgi:hypothetical protein
MVSPGSIRSIVLSLLLAPVLSAQTPAPGQDRAVRAFNDRVEAYIGLHRRVEGPIPPLAASQDMAEVYSLMSRLRDGIRAASGWKPGTFFTPDVLDLFRAHVTECLKRPDLEAMQEDFVEHSPPGLPPAKAGQPLPDDTPIMPVPPRLLARLPKLPAELRYVVFGKTFLLWDHHADMVVDIAPGLLEPTAYR